MIMQTNNDNYDCIDRFIESDRFKVALKQANVVATGGGQLTIPAVSNAKRTVNCLNCINYGKAIQVAKYCSKCTDFSEHKAIN